MTEKQIFLRLVLNNFILVLVITSILILKACDKQNEKKMHDNLIENGCRYGGINEYVGDFKIFLPNVFTPNGDGINENFIISFSSENTPISGNYHLKINQEYLGEILNVEFELPNNDSIPGSYNNTVWRGYKDDKWAEPGIYTFELRGNINGSDFIFNGDITVVTDFIDLDYCSSCWPFHNNDPVLWDCL